MLEITEQQRRFTREMNVYWKIFAVPVHYLHFQLPVRLLLLMQVSRTCVHRAKVFTRMKQYLNPRVCPCHTPLNTRHACCTRVAWPIPRVLLVCSHLSQSSQTPAGIDSEVCSVKLRKWALLPELLFLARSARWRACERTWLWGLNTLFRRQYEGPDLTPLTCRLNNSELHVLK